MSLRGPLRRAGFCARAKRVCGVPRSRQVERGAGRSRLCCEECGATAEDDRAAGWRAYLASDEDEESLEAVVYCPSALRANLGIAASPKDCRRR